MSQEQMLAERIRAALDLGEEPDLSPDPPATAPPRTYVGRPARGLWDGLVRGPDGAAARTPMRGGW